jgi:hypothetical protein
MLRDNIILIIFICIFLIIFYMIYYGKRKRENFWMTPSRSFKTERVASTNINNEEPDFFQVPNYQSVIAPRFSNVNYGPNLRNRFPNYSKMGMSEEPIYESDSYTSQSTHPQKKTFLLDPHNPSSIVSTSTDKEYFNEDNDLDQPIIYDRFIFANRNTRLRGQGDPIRGDLPVAPISGNWFIPNAAAGNNTTLTLRQGAMNVMGGSYNETSNELSNMIYNSSGGGKMTLGGIDWSDTSVPTVNNTKNTFIKTAKNGDVQVSAYV